MTEALIAAGAAIIVGLLSLVGVMITNSRANSKMQNEIKTSQAVTEERIDELTREVREHNNFAHRMPVVEEKLRNVELRVHVLEKFHRPPN